MNWILLVIIAVLFDVFRIFIDNYVSDVYFKKRSAVSQKMFYGFADAITGIGALSILIPSLGITNYSTAGFLLLSGVFSAVAGIPYLKALEIDDSTNLGIFIQLAPVLYLIIGWCFLGEAFSPMQLIAFFFILAAPLLIVITSRKRSRQTKLKAVIYAFIYVCISVIGNLIFVKANAGSANFVESLAFFLLGKGVSNIIIIWAKPKWHQRFKDVIKTSKGKALRPMVSNFLISLIKDFSYRGALVFAPTVALASAASDSAEPIVIFFMGLLLTLIWPKFGREKLNRRSILIHLAATVLVVIGVVLLQM
ncbi:EamA family transporter [Candidatus Saccharibacteria bacterium]|nr:EamA family transporter [Candidatus Saccharibacteria bacterium]